MLKCGGDQHDLPQYFTILIQGLTGHTVYAETGTHGNENDRETGWLRIHFITAELYGMAATRSQ